MIFNNTFDQNFGFYDTAALFVRQQTSQCKGVSVIQNNFLNNFGCTKFGGSVFTYECVPVNTALDGLDQAIDPQLSSMSPVNAKKVNVVLDSRRNLTVSTNTVDLRGNNYFRNFAGKGQGIVEIKGLTWVEKSNGNFTRNGENTAEAVAIMSDGRFRHVYQNVALNSLSYNLTFNALISEFS